MADAANRCLPMIDASRCVHDLSAVATCQRCAAACPSRALQLTHSALTFDEGACTSCGHCRAVCSEQAITLGAADIAPLVDTHGEQVFLACTQSVPDDGPGVVPCLHAISEFDLRAVADSGIGHLIVADAACQTCKHKAAATLEDRVASCNRIAVAQAKMKLKIESVTANVWCQRAGDAHREGRGLDRGRRSLFGGLFGGAVREPDRRHAEGPAISRFSPRIDVAACVACDACARICPHGAITLSRDGGGLHYAVEGARCTGCGLCDDVCENRAVSVVEFAAIETPRIMLEEQRCARCAAQFHEIKGRGAGPLCRICRGKPNAQRLFEVRP